MYGNEKVDANTNTDTDAVWIRTKNKISPHPQGSGDINMVMSWTTEFFHMHSQDAEYYMKWI